MQLATLIICIITLLLVFILFGAIANTNDLIKKTVKDMAQMISDNLKSGIFGGRN